MTFEQMGYRWVDSPATDSAEAKTTLVDRHGEPMAIVREDRKYDQVWCILLPGPCIRATEVASRQDGIEHAEAELRKYEGLLR